MGMYNIIMISSRFYHITSRMSLLLKVGGGGERGTGRRRKGISGTKIFFLSLVGWLGNGF